MARPRILFLLWGSLFLLPCKPWLTKVCVFGVNMLLADTMLKIPMPVALLVIVGVIAFAIGASLFRRPVEAVHGEGTQTLFDR